MSPHLWRLFLWQVVRDVSRHPGLALLNILSIALGAAVYLAIQVANSTANRSFAASVDLVAGKAHLEVRGEPPEHLWAVIEKTDGVAAVTPLVEGAVVLPSHPGEYLRVLGVDIFSGAEFRTFALGEKDAAKPAWDFEKWLREPGQVSLASGVAERLSVRVGDVLEVQANGQRATLTVHSLIAEDSSPTLVGQPAAIMDIGWAQELLGMSGRLSAIQIRAAEPSRTEALAERLRGALPGDLAIETPRQRSQQMQTMVSAFQLNLTALSMVSLLVGVFLVYNTISGSVVRRRREIGILRCVGASRLEVRLLFLAEACLYGSGGIVLGIAAGFALSILLSGAVAQTISSLYVLTSVSAIRPEWWQIVTAALLAGAAVLAGAWLPAAEASRVHPIAALSMGTRVEESERRQGGWTAVAGAAIVLAAGLCFFALQGGPPVLSFGAAFFVLAAFASVAPAATRASGGWLAWHSHRLGIVLRLAADFLRRSVHRNAVTVAALSTAIAMLAGLTIMIHSFRQSVGAWVEQAISADLFIAPAANEVIGLGAELSPDLLAFLRNDSRVKAVDAFREQRITLHTADGRPRSALLGVIDGAFRGNLDFQGGGAEAKAAAVFGGDGAAISESFARRYTLGEGDRLRIATPKGEATFPIVGIYSDYTRDAGVAFISRASYERYWPEMRSFTASVYLQESAAMKGVADEIRTRFGPRGELAVYDNASLRRRIMDVFDETFRVTVLLRYVAVLVALAGVYLAVTTLAAERQREIGILRALGASPGQIRGMLVSESALVGAIACVLGLAAGAALSLVLTLVVNPAFFGWTIQYQVPGADLAVIPLWIIGAAVIAAWLPAQRAARANIAEEVREE